MRPRSLVLLASAMSLAGCASMAPPSSVQAQRSTSPCGFSTIAFWGQHEVPADELIDGKRIGGLSGIDRSPAKNEWISVSDDRGPNGGARAFLLRLTAHPDHSIEVRWAGAFPLRGPDADIDGSTDAEAIRYSRDGSAIYWASEGGNTAGSQPGLYRAKAGGTSGEAISLPPKLRSNASLSAGPRENRSFEALAVDPADGGIWLGLEAPLADEGEPPTVQHGAITPIVRLGRKGIIEKWLRYPLEPIAHQEPGLLADNGLSELLVMPGPAFLVLERSGSQQPDGSYRFTNRIYCAWRAPGGRPMRKVQVADINDLGAFDKLNFEGMAFGPELPDGRRSLVLVSDNNFAEGVPSEIALFSIEPIEQASAPRR